MLEQDSNIESDLGIQILESLIRASSVGQACAILTNPSGFTQRVDGGVTLGMACEAAVVEPLNAEILPREAEEDTSILAVKSDLKTAARQKKLLEIVGEPESLNQEQGKMFNEFLLEHRARSFFTRPRREGETDTVQFEIDIGDATPKRQLLRRMPFLVRQEVARQLKSTCSKMELLVRLGKSGCACT